MVSEFNSMNRLKAVLKEQGRTQKWFASHMNRTENTISLWTTNKVQPSLEDLYRAARLLDIDVRDLLEGNLDIS